MHTKSLVEEKLVETKTKYEVLREQLDQAQLTQLPIIRELIEDVDRARKEFKSEQSFFRYLALLINLEIMAQGSIGTAVGSERIDPEHVLIIKNILSNQINRRDHQFSYICCLAQRLNLVSQNDLIEQLGRATALENSNMDVGGLKNNFIASVLSAVNKCLAKENNDARRAMLNNLKQCCENFTRENFDPLMLPEQQDDIIGLQRFQVGPNKKPQAYFETMLKFEKEEFNTRFSQQMRDSIVILKNGAAEFFHNAELSVQSKTQCNDLMNQIHEFLNSAADIQNLQNDPADTPPDASQLNGLLLQARSIHQSINRLESVAPRTELNWTRIIVVSALTVLVGALLWVIPSLAISGQSSFFRKSPLITEARELFENIEEDLRGRIQELDRQDEPGRGLLGSAND